MKFGTGSNAERTQKYGGSKYKMTYIRPNIYINKKTSPIFNCVTPVSVSLARRLYIYTVYIFLFFLLFFFFIDGPISVNGHVNGFSNEVKGVTSVSDSETVRIPSSTKCKSSEVQEVTTSDSGTPSLTHTPRDHSMKECETTPTVEGKVVSSSNV